MDLEIEVIAKKYNLDEKSEKKKEIMMGEGRITHKSFDVVSPPTLIHKRLEDKIRTLELENKKLYKRIAELNEKNKKLEYELGQVKDLQEDYSFRKGNTEEIESKNKIIEEYEENLKFLQEQIDFLIENHENDLKIKEAEASFLKEKVSYFASLPSIESLALMRETIKKLDRDNQVLKANQSIQDEIIEKLKSELTLQHAQESEAFQAITETLKSTQKKLSLEKASNKKLSEDNLKLSSGLKSIEYELELTKSRSPRFLYTSLLPSPSKP
jgi:chromosome segregation ATPase